MGVLEAPSPRDPSPGSPNRYAVQMRRERDGWTVAILDQDGREVASRACRHEAEARTYASTVRQHASWLSEAAFRSYYRLEG